MSRYSDLGLPIVVADFRGSTPLGFADFILAIGNLKSAVNLVMGC